MLSLNLKYYSVYWYSFSTANWDFLKSVRDINQQLYWRQSLISSFIYNSFSTVKKSIAILLLLIYGSVAFSAGANCSYCNGKMIHSSSHGSDQSQCGCSNSQMNMDCCGAKTLSCKTDDSQRNQVINSALSISFADHFANNSLRADEYLFQAIQDRQVGYNLISTHNQSSRDLLAFIHVLRI